MASKVGSVEWFEILSDEPEKAVTFYSVRQNLSTAPAAQCSLCGSDVLDWQIKLHEDVPVKFFLAQTGKTPAGKDSTEGVDGAISSKLGFGPSQLTVSTAVVESIEDTIAQAEKAGGAVVWGPKDVPVGRFAYLQDCMGTYFGVIQMSSQDEKDEKASTGDTEQKDVQADGSFGRVVYFNLMSEDPERSVAFYSAVLGWKFGEPDLLPNGEFYWQCATKIADPTSTEQKNTLYMNGGVSGLLVADGYKLEPGTVNFVKVKSIREVEAKLLKAGGKKLTEADVRAEGGPFDTMAWFADNMGMVIGVME